MEKDNVEKLTWNSIKVGDVLPDGSMCIQRHPTHIESLIKISYKRKFKKEVKSVTVSTDHLFLCKIPKNKKTKMFIKSVGAQVIPRKEDLNVYAHNRFISKDEEEKIRNYYTNGETSKIPGDVIVSPEIIEIDYKLEDENLTSYIVWLSALEISNLLNNTTKNITSNGCLIVSSEYVGEGECFCISTDSGKYQIRNGFDLLSHNSVAVRNIILHCLTHGITLGLVDLKLTEFAPYKGHYGVLGVANSVSEAAELLRIGRVVMKKRNSELEEKGVVQMSDYIAKNPTNLYRIFGREFNGDEIVEVKDGDNVTSMKVSDLHKILTSSDNGVEMI